MKIEDLVGRYIDAWNRCNVADLLALMHKGVAFYDAFWMECCVGRDLTQYFHDSFVEEPYSYRQVGDAIPTESGVVFRYSTHDRSDTKFGKVIYYGAEVLNIRDGLILTISDYYCNPERANLVEVARVATRRHSVLTHAKSGLSAIRSLRLRNRLSALVDRDTVSPNSSLTILQLADQIGCTVEQLLNVIDDEYGTNFYELMGDRSTIYAKDILPKMPYHES